MWINVGCNFLYFVVIPCVYIYIISMYYVPRTLVRTSERSLIRGPHWGPVKACNPKIHLCSLQNIVFPLDFAFNHRFCELNTHLQALTLP